MSALFIAIHSLSGLADLHTAAKLSLCLSVLCVCLCVSVSLCVVCVLGCELPNLIALQGINKVVLNLNKADRDIFKRKCMDGCVRGMDGWMDGF